MHVPVSFSTQLESESLEHLLAKLNVVGYMTAALARVVSGEVHKTQ